MPDVADSLLFLLVVKTVCANETIAMLKIRFWTAGSRLMVFSVFIHHSDRLLIWIFLFDLHFWENVYISWLIARRISATMTIHVVERPSRNHILLIKWKLSSDSRDIFFFILYWNIESEIRINDFSMFVISVSLLYLLYSWWLLMPFSRMKNVNQRAEERVGWMIGSERSERAT